MTRNRQDLPMSITNEPTNQAMPPEPNADKPATRSRLRRRWWLLGSVALLFAFLVSEGLAACYYAYRRHQTNEDLNEDIRAAVEELDRTEPGWRLRDLEAARAVIPEDQNSALVMIEAYRLLPPDWQPTTILDRFKDVPPQMRLDDLEAADLRDELAKLQAPLAEARKVATLPNGRYPITFPRNPGAVDLHDVQHARHVAGFLQCDVLAQAHDGDSNGALRSCRAQLNAGRSIGDQPLMIPQLVRIAAVGITFKSAERVLNQTEPDPKDLLALQRLLEEEERFPRLLVSVRGERAVMHEVAAAVECGDIPFSEEVGQPTTWRERLAERQVVDMLRAAHPNLLRLHSEGVAIAALPAHERVQPMQALETKWRRQPGIERGLYPVTEVIDRAARRIDGQLRCLITALAIERYRRQHDRLPNTLEQLVPNFLAAVPIDPLDGEPLGYQRLDDKIVVYARCPIITLDWSQAYDPDEPSPPGVGIAVHLYNVNHRRQPWRELLPFPEIDDDSGSQGPFR
jgi:hypothetical protein